MKYCSRCLYPENHPLTIVFDSEGICSGCRVHEEKYNLVDWNKREQEFSEIISNYKGKYHPNYDCIIPVTGAGDDFYVVDLIKSKYGLNPILVTYNSHFSTKVGVRNLARLCTELDCDHMHYTVGPDTVKRLTKLSLEKLGHVYWHVLAGHLSFPVQVGTKLNIPLIVWGVHAWSDQVGMFSHLDSVEMTEKVRKEHSLKMFSSENFKGEDIELSDKDLMAFQYPSSKQLEKSAVRGIYLSNFFKWDSQDQIEKVIVKFGYETEEAERTFNTYETIHCHVMAGVHDYIKYLKYGYGKATDHASRDIRLKRMTREEGIRMVEKYDHIRPANFNVFLEWLGITESYFYECVDKFRDPNVWEKKQNEWIYKNDLRVGNDSLIDRARLIVDDRRKYIKTTLVEKSDEEFILTGRTYLDPFNNKAIEG